MTPPGEPLRSVYVLPARQAKPAGKGFGDAEEFERELTSRFAAGVACEPFVPTETEMRPLTPCEYNRCAGGQASGTTASSTLTCW